MHTKTHGVIKADGEMTAGQAQAAANMAQLGIVDKADAAVFKEYSTSHGKADIFKFYATVPGEPTI